MSVRPIDGQRSFYHTDYLAGNLFEERKGDVVD
jgi:hypothetical protein